MVAFTLFNADFWLWHAPPLYDTTLINQPLHILEHLTFILFGPLYWWPMFSQVKGGLRLSMGGQVLYLFFGSMPMVLLGAGLTFAPPLYAPYIYAPHVWGLSPATDQQLAGRIADVGSRQPSHDRDHEHPVHSLDAAARTSAT